MTGIIEGFEIFNSGIFFWGGGGGGEMWGVPFWGGGWGGGGGGGGGVGKFGKYLFGWVDLSKDFFGYSKQSEVSW